VMDLHSFCHYEQHPCMSMNLHYSYYLFEFDYSRYVMRFEHPYALLQCSVVSLWLATWNN